MNARLVFDVKGFLLHVSTRSGIHAAIAPVQREGETTMRRSISRALAGVTVLVVLAAPAAAVPPDHFTFHDEFSGDISDILPCSFPVSETFTLDGRGTDHFDQDGNFVRAEIHIKAEAWFTNDQTGYTLFDRDSFTVLVDGGSGEVSVVGISFHINVPGEGIVVLSAGKVTFDADGEITFLAGPHDQITSGGQALCDALDPAA
jgi:hypothetical protein